MKNGLVLGLLLLGVAGQAVAGGSLRAGLAGGSFEEESDVDAELDLSGVDLRAAFELDRNFFIRGQYLVTQSDEVEIDGEDFDVDTDLNILRLGLGYGGEVGAVRLYGALEFVDLDIEIEGENVGDNGYGITGGIRDLGKSNVVWAVELSLIDINGTSGASFDGTIGYQFTPAFTGFLGVQSYAFEDDDDVETSAGVATISGQFNF